MAYALPVAFCTVWIVLCHSFCFVDFAKNKCFFFFFYSCSLRCKYPTRCTLEYSFVWTVAITASGPDNSDATTLHIVCLPRPWPNTASQTNRTLYSFPQLHQMLTDFQNSFTVGLSSDSLKIPTHLTRRYTTLRNRSEVTDLVSTLSCTLLSIVSLKTGLLVSSDI